MGSKGRTSLLSNPRHLRRPHEEEEGAGRRKTLFLLSFFNFFYFTLLFLNNNKLKNVTFFLNNYKVDMTCGKKRIKN
jgi:hypothetical protein